MESSNYYNINIDGNHYTLTQTKDKPSSAADMLKKIESIVFNNLSPEGKGSLSHTTKQELVSIAEEIKQRYQKKLERNPITRLFRLSSLGGGKGDLEDKLKFLEHAGLTDTRTNKKLWTIHTANKCGFEGDDFKGARNILKKPLATYVDFLVNRFYFDIQP